MLKRIVKLTFHHENVDKFLTVFNTKKQFIRNVKGCQHLELLRCTDKSNIFFTYSYWDSEDDLNNYRHSELFKNTWAKTKVLFSEKPEAWSVEAIHIL